MQRDFIAYLEDILMAGQDIEEYTGGFDLEMYQAVGLVQAGVERKFTIIAEAISRCKQHFPGQAGLLGLVQPIIDFRNHLVHRYDVVASEIVWDIIKNDLPLFLEDVRALLARCESEAKK